MIQVLGIPNGYGSRSYQPKKADFISGQESANMFRNNFNLGQDVQQADREGRARNQLSDRLSQPIEPTQMDEIAVRDKMRAFREENPQFKEIPEEVMFQDFMKKRMLPQQQAQQDNLMRSQTDVKGYLNPTGSGTSGRQSVYELKQKARMDVDDQYKIIDQSVARIKQLDDADSEGLTAEKAKIAGAMNRIQQATGKTPSSTALNNLMGDSMKRNKFGFEQNKQSYRVSEDREKDINSVYDNAMGMYQKIGLNALAEGNKRFNSAKNLYQEARSGDNQSAQQQFLTNILKISDASQVLLSEADANKSQAWSNQVNSLLQSALQGSKIPASDIDNIMITGNKLQESNNEAGKAKLKAITTEFNRRITPYSGKKGTKSFMLKTPEELSEDLLGYEQYGIVPNLETQTGSWNTGSNEAQGSQGAQTTKTSMGGF